MIVRVNDTSRLNSVTNQVNNQSLIPTIDVIQLTLTLKMTTAEVVETFFKFVISCLECCNVTRLVCEQALD